MAVGVTARRVGWQPTRTRGITMGALLDAESRRLETEQRWAAIEAAYDRMQQEDPAGWQGYLGELGELTAGDLDTRAL